uniref:DDE-1 domain-containing protein n=1 Tax=Hyaloperonospora arabidopsidis (strain Emoy2) TaxID=559515 RepID=M4BFY8_HYAAE
MRTVRFLYPNTTSHLQPADAGIANFKIKYKTRYIEYLLEKFDATGDHPFEPRTSSPSARQFICSSSRGTTFNLRPFAIAGKRPAFFPLEVAWSSILYSTLKTLIRLARFHPS